MRTGMWRMGNSAAVCQAMDKTVRTLFTSVDREVRDLGNRREPRWRHTVTSTKKNASSVMNHAIRQPSLETE
jgi:hypothetical protein